jgi:hypothetical protein
MKFRELLLYAGLILSSCAKYQRTLVDYAECKAPEDMIEKGTFSFQQHSYLDYAEKNQGHERKYDLANVIERVRSHEKLSSRYYSISFHTLTIMQLECYNTNDSLLYVKNYGGEFDNRNFFHLDNKLLNCWGVPYIFGGCEHEKTRIGITEDHGLVVQHAYDDFGAILIFFGSGRSFNSVILFRSKE